MTQRKHSITLKEVRSSDGQVSLLQAYIDDNGDLVLAGYDLGESVREVWGDSDYEYWRRVRAEHVPEVLLQLLKERFSVDTEFRQWLETNGIKAEFQSWI
jgi:hypothetical protein